MLKNLSRNGNSVEMEGQRIKSKKVHIDDRKVHGFFDNRVNKKLPYIINYTNYQDNHPEMALERDKYEHKVIEPYLKLQANSRVLDIGCGVGRWGKHVLEKISQAGCYIGVDYSPNILNLARKNLRSCERDNCALYNGNFRHICSVLPEAELDKGFDAILVNGVMMYINDNDIPKCILNMKNLLKNGGRIYLKEPIGIANRLTLDNIYSEELSSRYSAIYRTVAEYDGLIEEYLLTDGLRVVHKDIMWQGKLANRKETTIYFWIIEK